jgi:hypothetical protein
MQITPTPLKGLFQIEPDVFGDARGKFVEIFRESRYDAAGIDKPFVQDNFSWSVRGTSARTPLSASSAAGEIGHGRQGYGVTMWRSIFGRGRRRSGSGTEWSYPIATCGSCIFLPVLPMAFACSARTQGFCISVRMSIPRRMSGASYGMIRLSPLPGL